MAALPLVGSPKLSLLAVYCFVIVSTRYISSIKCSPVPQDAGGFQKPHFQVMKNFSESSILSVARELERSLMIALSFVIYGYFRGFYLTFSSANHLTSLRGTYLSRYFCQFLSSSETEEFCF